MTKVYFHVFGYFRICKSYWNLLGLIVMTVHIFNIGSIVVFNCFFVFIHSFLILPPFKNKIYKVTCSIHMTLYILFVYVHSILHVRVIEKKLF